MDVVALLQSIGPMMGGGGAFQQLLGFSIGLSIIHMRRFRTLTPQERFIFLVHLGTLAGFGCLAASRYPLYYSVYAYPWIILVVLVFLSKAASSRISLDRTDIFILCSSTVAFFAFSLRSRLEIWFFYLLFAFAV